MEVDASSLRNGEVDTRTHEFWFCPETQKLTPRIKKYQSRCPELRKVKVDASSLRNGQVDTGNHKILFLSKNSKVDAQN